MPRQQTLAIELHRDPSARIVEHLSEPVVVLAVPHEGSATPTVAYANPAAVRLLGGDEHALLGQSVHALASGSTEPLELARLIDAVTQQRPIDLTMQVASVGGAAVWTMVQGRPLPGGDRRYLVHLHDVTTYRTLVTMAQRLERRFEALAQLTSDSVYQLRVEADCRLALEWTAGAFERLIGYTPREIDALGGWSALIDPLDARIVQRRAQKLLAGEKATAEYRIKGKDGTRRWVRDTGWPQWDDARELVVGALCVLQDINDLRTLEERIQLQQLERRSLLGLMDGVLCEIDAESRIRAVSGGTGGQLPKRLRAAVGRSLQDVVGFSAAEMWRRQSQGILPGWRR